MGTLCSSNRGIEAFQRYQENASSYLPKAYGQDDELLNEVKNLTISCQERVSTTDAILERISRNLETIVANGKESQKSFDTFKTNFEIYQMNSDKKFEIYQKNFETFQLQRREDIDKMRAHNLILEEYLSTLMADNPRAAEFVAKVSTLFRYNK